MRPIHGGMNRRHEQADAGEKVLYGTGQTKRRCVLPVS